MRSKLQKFADFANALLPHEADYLLSVQRFEDGDKRRLLLQVSANCRKITGFEPYDQEIDKRKYSSLKAWIEEKLGAVDVDREYEWLTRMEVLIMTDAIPAQDEKELLRLFRSADATAYNFLKLYDLGRIFRHYLLVRLRYNAHDVVSQFLEKHRTSYEYARLVNDKIHQATSDIVAQYSRNNAESMRWEHWLSGVFFESALDGYNRTLALIRLIFIAVNYRRFDLLPDKFDHLEALIRQGVFYSRRILLNYYSQRLLSCARAGDLAKAAYYGHLSVRARNNDYLYYVNNLASVLLRAGEPAEALDVLRQALQTAKNSQNFHNKIGHAAYLCLALNKSGLYRQADTHARAFFEAYRKEVFNHRWHLFFSAWLEAKLGQGQFAAMLKMAATHQLPERDAAYRKNASYTPVIPWLLALAAYKSGKSSLKALTEQFSADLLALYAQNGNAFPPALHALLQSCADAAPELLSGLKAVLWKKGVAV